MSDYGTCSICGEDMLVPEGFTAQDLLHSDADGSDIHAECCKLWGPCGVSRLRIITLTLTQEEYDILTDTLVKVAAQSAFDAAAFDDLNDKLADAWNIAG